MSRSTYAYFFLLCIFALPVINGQSGPILKDPRDYFEKVVNNLWGKIKEYGLSNLPVVDFALEYNVSSDESHAMELIGNVSFENGFVMDVESVEPNYQQFTSSLSQTSAMIASRVAFKELEIFEDFRGSFTTGKKLGTVVLAPNLFDYMVTIRKNLSSNAVVPEVIVQQINGLTWKFHPDDEVTGRMRRHYIQYALSESKIIIETARGWIPILVQLLEETIEELGFPALQY